MNEAKPAPIRLSREQLYEEIWKTPARLLSVRFGISDVGLAKVCKRMGIPRPTRGYWRKKETGHRVRRVALPKSKPEHRQEVVFFAETGTVPRRWKGARIAPEIFLTFDQPHPYVEITSKSLRTASSDIHGILALPATAPLSVKVSRNNLSKALRIADAFLKAWLDQGHELQPKTEEIPFAWLSASPVELHFAIREEKDGRLCVELSGKRISRRRSYRRRLREKIRLSLEAWTGRIFAVALHYVERRKQVILDLERKQRELEQWKIDCERRARDQRATVRRWQEERRKTDALIKGESEWRRAKEFREFIAACRDQMIESGENPDQIEQWVAWALSKAGRPLLDPKTSIEQTILETREVEDVGDVAA